MRMGIEVWARCGREAFALEEQCDNRKLEQALISGPKGNAKARRLRV